MRGCCGRASSCGRGGGTCRTATKPCSCAGICSGALRARDVDVLLPLGTQGVNRHRARSPSRCDYLVRWASFPGAKASTCMNILSMAEGASLIDMQPG